MGGVIATPGGNNDSAVRPKIGVRWILNFRRSLSPALPSTALFPSPPWHELARCFTYYYVAIGEIWSILERPFIFPTRPFVLRGREKKPPRNKMTWIYVMESSTAYNKNLDDESVRCDTVQGPPVCKYNARERGRGGVREALHCCFFHVKGKRLA